MAKDKKRKRIAVGGPSLIRRFLFSRPVMLLLLLIIALALLFAFQSQVLSGLSTAWEALVEACGWGLILVAVVMAFLGWMIWRRHVPVFMRKWHRWLGTLAFIVALCGLLAFFKASTGVMSEATLGGRLGLA
ncbi:MAG: DNA translocase FtsK 4TM domain-containing protein, partial [Dehalococcoidia bacterium]|nr:DNA translocase FtsK 4TM domain-containing protein [Dehalococcoidia bacterium]